MGFKDGGLDWYRFKVFKQLTQYGEGAIAPAKGIFFCLNCNGTDPHALKALKAYGESVSQENPELAKDIENFVP
jgi:hypothetical protein